MSLKMLVESLRAIPAKEIRNVGTKLARERVVYPPKWEDGKTQVHQAIWRKTKGYNLRLRAFLKKTPSETTLLLTTLLDQVRGMQFTPGTFKVNTEVYWPTEAFLQERDLGDLTEVRVRGSFYACDPAKVRIGFPGNSHELEVELKDKSLQISAQGDYSALLPRLINELKPQFATIRLSASDAQCWLNKTKGFWKRRLKRALQPKKQTHLALQMGGGISFVEKEEIETTIATSMLSACAEGIGKPLINEVTGEQSFVVKLTKVLSRKSQILPMLQSVVQIIGDLKTRTVFDYPLLTTSQAKEMLEKEIDDIVSRSYEDWSFFGTNTHMVRGPLVKRLVREHFGFDDDILVHFEEMDAPQYLAFLQNRGFKYDGEMEKKLEPPYILKEMYLLQFFRQSYANDPCDSVERFRCWYVNSAPTVKITGKAESDASRITSLSLPAQALLSGFSLEECSRQGDNEVAISPHSENRVHFWIRISLDSCRLLNLQEKVCKIMGVVCY